MTAASIGIEGALGALERASGATSLRVWMEAHRDELLSALDGRRLNWKALCAWFTEVGLTNAKGEAPSVGCAKLLWHRVGKTLEARRQRHADAASAAERLAEEKKAAREAAKASRDAEAAEAETLSQRMQEADRAESYATSKRAEVQDAHARAAVQRQERNQQQAARTQQNEIAPSDPSEFITLDLPVLKGVSNRAYLPVDPKLAPVRDGDINRYTGSAWRYGGDLPGYPSKRNYEYEKEWLRDVGLLLRHRHPTNLTMTPEEKFVMRGAKSCIPNLY
ncbi:hypothetical protein [Gluconobacter cerinus]|uniref:hypothetical protein n=1 Tax=Gluconobacter cerinus TaxID=38307 RepID=UPI001B8C0AEA|nr:hypothetical protein [Gluconobacter cerinus]MBS0983444.1 hypothetical protein [Gluconobacter cerinus]